MRLLLIIAVFFFTTHIFAQSVRSEVKLSSEITLRGVIEKFDVTKHKYDTCGTTLGWESICLIDGQIWYGCDAGLELPKNQLTELIITIGKQEITLDVSGMFNPNLENVLSANQFKWQPHETGYNLYGYFSDGAGTYTVHWKIVKNKSIKQVITTDERAFYWQVDK
jgi:hypothetical protein